MWGITLQRAGKPDEAITVLTSGLQFAEPESRENLGLRYHIGRAHELADRPDPATEIYEEIQAAAPNFLDVSKRLAQLSGVGPPAVSSGSCFSGILDRPRLLT